MKLPDSLAMRTRTPEEARQSVWDFETMRHAAVRRIQGQTGTSTWTDYNVHDPGVTLLESMLWAIQDLAFRTVRASAATTTTLPIHETPPARLGAEELSAARRSAFAYWDELVDRARNDPEAQNESSDAMQRWIRIATHHALTEVFTKNQASLARLSGLKSLLTMARLFDELCDATDPRHLDEILAQLARLDDLACDPLVFEHEDGSCRVWPPHPTQCLTGPTATAGDYARVLAHRMPAGVARVWVARGAVRGLRWDGAPQLEDEPDLPNAVSILIQPEQELTEDDNPKFLLDACRRAVLAEEVDRNRRHWCSDDVLRRRAMAKEHQATHETVIRTALRPKHLHDQTPDLDSQLAGDVACSDPDQTPWSTRLMADRLYFGLVVPVSLRVHGRVQLVGPRPDDLAHRLHTRLKDWLTGSAESTAGVPSPDTEWLGAAPAWEYNKREEDFPGFVGGWQPGRPVTIAGVRQTLVSDPNVAAVHGLSLEGGRSTWDPVMIPLGPFEVPTIDEDGFDCVVEGGTR